MDPSMPSTSPTHGVDGGVDGPDGLGKVEGVDGVTQSGVLVDTTFVGEEVVIDLKGYSHGAVLYQAEPHDRFITTVRERKVGSF